MFWHGPIGNYANSYIPKKLEPVIKNNNKKKSTLAFQNITGLELNKTEAGKECSLTLWPCPEGLWCPHVCEGFYLQ